MVKTVKKWKRKKEIRTKGECQMYFVKIINLIELQGVSGVAVTECLRPAEVNSEVNYLHLKFK